jgi:hypothetical protein
VPAINIPLDDLERFRRRWGIGLRKFGPEVLIISPAREVMTGTALNPDIREWGDERRLALPIRLTSWTPDGARSHALQDAAVVVGFPDARSMIEFHLRWLNPL